MEVFRPIIPILILSCLAAPGEAAAETTPPSCDEAPYDVDGNSAIESLSDGVLLLRYFFGFRGNPLIAGALGDGCTRCTAPDIEEFIALGLAGCPLCGDLTRDSGEECDGNDLGGSNCATFGYISGNLTCNSDCTFEVRTCGNCGNGVVDVNEECDGPDHNGETCQTQGFSSGQLACRGDCNFNTSACIE